MKGVVWRDLGMLPGCGCQMLIVIPPSGMQAFVFWGSVFGRVGGLPAAAAGASLCLRAIASFRPRSKGRLVLCCGVAPPACSCPLLRLISGLAEALLLSLCSGSAAWRAYRNLCWPAWMVVAVSPAVGQICHHLAAVVEFDGWRRVFFGHP